MAVEATEHPVQFGDSQRSANARTRRIFHHSSGKVCLAQPSVERQPGSNFDLILCVDSDKAAVRILRQRCNLAAPIVVNDMEKLIVLLSETVETYACVIGSLNPRHGPLAPFIFGGTVLRCSTGEIIWIAHVVGAVVMEE